MANKVYANDDEIACKAGSGKSICAFPDVCMTPPENPATPPGVPGALPQHRHGERYDRRQPHRQDLRQGGHAKEQELLQARAWATRPAAPPRKGVVTSVNRGKVYFIAWSMDVKFEGLEVPRHVDLITHNHASPQTNTAPWTNVSKQKVDGHSCAPIVAKFHEYKDADCPSGSQSHHVVDNANFTMARGTKGSIEEHPGRHRARRAGRGISFRRAPAATRARTTPRATPRASACGVARATRAPSTARHTRIPRTRPTGSARTASGATSRPGTRARLPSKRPSTSRTGKRNA